MSSGLSKSKARITFKAKIENEQRFLDGKLVWRRVVRVKQKLQRRDCDLRQHGAINSNMYPAFLKRAMAEVIGNARSLDVDALPPGVSVDESEFLAKVTVEVLL